MFQMNYILDWSCNLEKIHSAIVAYILFRGFLYIILWYIHTQQTSR